jgi:cbb3-type cytochrome oxidase subunit 3
MTVQLLLLLLSPLSPALILGSVINLVMLAGFLALIKHVFAPEKREYYRQESLIPLEDETEAEKLSSPSSRPQRIRLDA